MLGDFLKNARSLLQNSTTSRSKISNHSARKTCISTLLNNNGNLLHVTQLSGHKNVDSLKSYHTASEQQQKQMSNMLNSHPDSSSSSTVSKHLFEGSAVTVNPIHHSCLGSSFHGANISNCVFNVNITQNFTSNPKKRRIIYSSDEE